jgi:hypothetical protein
MVDALCRDGAEPEVAEVVVVGGRDAEMDVAHGSPFSRLDRLLSAGAVARP